jgi:hypothetical protein
METKLYHIVLGVRGMFLLLGCKSLYEEYCFELSSMEAALNIAKELDVALQDKAQCLGAFEESENIQVTQVDTNPLPAGNNYYTYGYPL